MLFHDDWPATPASGEGEVVGRRTKKGYTKREHHCSDKTWFLGNAVVRCVENRMPIDDDILGVWQSQGDLKEYRVFHADGTYRMVIPGAAALGIPDSTHAEGRFITDSAKRPAHLDLAVGGAWQFFIY
jgi:hypothetical protein